jgi:hypothetical protein
MRRKTIDLDQRSERRGADLARAPQYHEVFSPERVNPGAASHCPPSGGLFVVDMTWNRLWPILMMAVTVAVLYALYLAFA